MSGGLPPVQHLKKARDFAVNQNESEFLLVRNAGNSPNVGKLNIGRRVQQEVAKLTHDSLSELVDNLRQGRTRSRRLNVANTISEESIVQYSHIDNLPDTDTFDLLNSRDTHDYTTYSEDPTPNFQLVRISEPDGKLLIAVQNYSNAELVDTHSGLALFYEEEEYSRFAGDILVIRPNFNAFYYDGYVFIISPKSFERMFDMREEYEKRAGDALDGFRDAGITFQDEGKIRKWLLSHINILRAMYEINESGIPDRATPKDIAQIIDRYSLASRTSIRYQQSSGKISIDLDKYTDSWKLIKVLAGKFAEDTILGEQWEIDSGQRL